jgi:hypothetical protein
VFVDSNKSALPPIRNGCDLLNCWRIIPEACRVANDSVNTSKSFKFNSILPLNNCSNNLASQEIFQNNL